jgi:hypothetical protein
MNIYSNHNIKNDMMYSPNQRMTKVKNTLRDNIIFGELHL